MNNDNPNPGIPQTGTIKLRRWRRPLTGLLIFACGLLLGATGTLLFVRYRILHAMQHPEEAPARITAHLRRKFDLTRKQAKQVREIVVHRQQALQVIRREVQPRVMAELDRAEQEIAGVLTPAQKADWHQWFKQMRSTWIPPLPPMGNPQTER